MRRFWVAANGRPAGPPPGGAALMSMIQHLVDCLRAHVRHAGGNVARKFPLHREVPRLYVAAMQRAAPRSCADPYPRLAAIGSLPCWCPESQSPGSPCREYRSTCTVRRTRTSIRSWLDTSAAADARRAAGHKLCHSRCAPPYFPSAGRQSPIRGANSFLLVVMPTFFGLLPTPPIYTRLVAGSHRSMPRSALEISG